MVWFFIFLAKWKKMKFVNSILNLFTFLKRRKHGLHSFSFLSTLSSFGRQKFKGFIPYLKYSFLRIMLYSTYSNKMQKQTAGLIHTVFHFYQRMLSVEKQIELITEPLKVSLPSLTSYSLVCSQPRSI